MRALRLNENRLIEMHRRKYLNELLDFCLYESCLQEEAARDYFEWLKDRVVEDKRFDFERKDYYKGGKKSKVNYSTDILEPTAVDRFKYEQRFMNQTDFQHAYFQSDDENKNLEKGKNIGISLDDFINEFKNYLKTRKDVSDSQRMKIADCFEYYCDMFAKDKFVEYDWWTTPTAPTFSDEVSWKNKKLASKVGGIKRGESHKSPFDKQNIDKKVSKKAS